MSEVAKRSRKNKLKTLYSKMTGCSPIRGRGGGRSRKELSELQTNLNVNQLSSSPSPAQVKSPIATTDMTKTPLRGNVSAKITSCLQTSRTIAGRLCCSDTFNAHIISGPRGIGKTFVAHNAIRLPMVKRHFSDGVVWIGLGNLKPLNFQELVELYERIYSQVYPNRTIDFDKVIFVPSKESTLMDIDDDEGDQDEKKAMLKAREIMSKSIAQKKILICIDEVFDVEDVQYFQFDLEVSSEVNCRVLATTGNTTISYTLNSDRERVKFWQLSPMNVVQSRKFFLKQLNTHSINHPDFVAKYCDCHQSCHGNPRCIIVLSRMIDDKLKGEKYSNLKKFVTKFANAPLDPKMEAYIILEAMFSHSSLGENHTKLAWRCFAAFTCVFTRSDCYRPFIPSSPCKALFRAIISRVGKMTEDPGTLNKVTASITEFMVENGLLTRIDGFDDQKRPRMFYQVSCDMYQEFGQELSSSSQTHRKLNELLINEYTTMFNGINTAFGSNDIDVYMLKFLPEHSLKANELDDASMTLQDKRFIEERLKYMGVKIGCKRHIHDAEKLLEAMGAKNGSTKMFHLALTKAIQSCAEVIETQFKKKDRKLLFDYDTMVDCFWDLALSLLKEGLVRSGCKILQMANEVESNDKKASNLLEQRLIDSLAKTPSENKKQCSRALILIGSAMAQHDIRLRDSIQLLHNGLLGLEMQLGYGNLEVARARVYVGEILYRDFKLYDRALQKFRQALPTLMTDLGEESEELFDAIILIGKSCIHTGDLDTALDILLNLSPKLSGTVALDVDIKIGYIYIIKGDNESALSVLSKAKEKTTDEAVIQRIDQMIEKSLGVKVKGRYSI